MNISIRFNPDCLFVAKFCSMLSPEKNVIAMSARPDASIVVFSAWLRGMFHDRQQIGLVYEALLQVTHAVLNYPEEARITVRALDKLIAFRIWVALRDRGKLTGKHG
jgi:hypothetical protein